jgi:pimeloyl-ACP methyl ester carboxylesterase
VPARTVPNRQHAQRLAVAIALLSTLALACAPAGAASAKHRRLGSLTLHRCEKGTRWWCGWLRRRLDPARPHGPHIRVGFRWLPPSGGRSKGPALVAVEGGPGFPSIGSSIEYTGTYGPLLRERGLLLVDQRGTGTSALITCKRIQNFTGITSSPGFPKLVAGCARQIERRYRRAGKRAVHAADLFATSYAVADFAAVLRRLRLGKVDLYGDSYGTWFTQSFISRHQRLLHSVILDSAYPVRGLDPWYASSGEVARRAMDAVCARDPACAMATGTEGATDRLAQLLERVRHGAISGKTRDSDASRVRARVDVRALVDMVQDAGSDPVIYRELDASVRAALAGDNAPLLRLTAQSQTYDHGGSTPDYFSDGLYFAVSCMDYPQLFSVHSSPARRRAQLRRRLLSPPATAFLPFTPREWLTISAYSEPYEACLDWPRPHHRAPVVPAKPRPLPASIPMLIVGGDLDSLTPLSDAQVFGPTLGKNVRVVTLPNTVHVTSEGDDMLSVGAGCARKVIRDFVRAPAGLHSLDTSCTGGIPPLHTPGFYPVVLHAALPATLMAGADPGLQARQAVTVAAAALADATVRHFYSGASRGSGLRGGTFVAKGDEPTRFKLSKIRFVRDATVSGSGRWRLSNGAVHGALTVRAADGAKYVVTLDWKQRSRFASARLGAATLTFPVP